jgi:hypothetical protein
MQRTGQLIFRKQIAGMHATFFLLKGVLYYSVNTGFVTISQCGVRHTGRNCSKTPPLNTLRLNWHRSWATILQSLLILAKITWRSGGFFSLNSLALWLIADRSVLLSWRHQGLRHSQFQLLDWHCNLLEIRTILTSNRLTHSSWVTTRNIIPGRGNNVSQMVILLLMLHICLQPWN